MWDPEVLEKCGCSEEAWRKIFERKNPKTAYPDKVQALVERIRSRVRGGIDYNLTNHAHWYALDLAWDAPFQQITPTLLSSFVDKPIDGPNTDKILQSWGIDVTDLWEEVPDPKTPGKTIRKLNVPAIVKVVPPLCKAYETMRWAKLSNDAKLTPLDKYDPAISDEISMMKSDALNHRVEVMNQQMGAFETRKSAIWRMLHYGECLAFPIEEWYREEQIHGKDSEEEGDDFKVGGKVVGKKVLVKEGIRHHLPHPSRTFFDRSHPAATFNSGTGCGYAGYWRIVTYGDIKDNKGLYNTEIISLGQMDWNTTNAYSYFVNLYKGCTINFPKATDPAAGGVSKLDTEKHVANGFYSTDMRDKSVLQTEYFELLKPSDWGLGDYDCPVWCRFVVASDNTVMYAAPVPYDAVIYYGYDNPGGRMLNASMTLEILPFQDQVGNILTQIYLSIRQNLTNLTMINTDFLDEDVIQTLKNGGQKWYQKINFAFFSNFKAQKGRHGDPGQTIISQRFPQLDVVSLHSAIRVTLEMLERILGMSSQELGQQASHEQTREEIRNISSNVSTRLQFTKLGVDAAQDAHKKQNYQALMALGSESFYALIPFNPKLDEKKLKELGITVKRHDEKSGKALVKVDKTAVMYELFSANRDGDDRVNDSETAKSMLAVLAPVIESPAMQQPLATAIGPDQALKALNLIGRMAGFPRDFKLTNVTDQQNQNPQVPVPVQQMIDGALKHVEDDVKGALTHVGDQINGQGQQVATLSQQVQSIQGTLQNLLQTAQQAPLLPQPHVLDSIQPQFSGPSPGAQFDPMAGAPGIPQPAQAV